jgi:hypothetical protein
MATATRNIDGLSMRRLPLATDGKDGVGLLDTLKAVRLAAPSNRVPTFNTARPRGRWRGTIDEWSFDGGKWNLSADRTGRMRVVMSWNGTATCSADFTSCSADALDADLDLWVGDSSGNTVCQSTSWDSSYEICDFPVTEGQQYTVRLYKYSFNRRTYAGLAWYRY